MSTAFFPTAYNNLFFDVYYQNPIRDEYTETTSDRSIVVQALKDAMADCNMLHAQLAMYGLSLDPVICNALGVAYMVSKYFPTLNLTTLKQIIYALYDLAYQLLLKPHMKTLLDDVIMQGNNMMKLMHNSTGQNLEYINGKLSFTLTDNVFNHECKNLITEGIKEIANVRKYRKNRSMNERYIVRANLAAMYKVVATGYKHEQQRIYHQSFQAYNQIQEMLERDLKYAPASSKDAAMQIKTMAYKCMDLCALGKLVDNNEIQHAYALQRQIQDLTMKHVMPYVH